MIEHFFSFISVNKRTTQLFMNKRFTIAIYQTRKSLSNSQGENKEYLHNKIATRLINIIIFNNNDLNLW